MQHQREPGYLGFKGNFLPLSMSVCWRLAGMPSKAARLQGRLAFLGGQGRQVLVDPPAAHRALGQSSRQKSESAPSGNKDFSHALILWLGFGFRALLMSCPYTIINALTPSTLGVARSGKLGVSSCVLQHVASQTMQPWHNAPSVRKPALLHSPQR